MYTNRNLFQSINKFGLKVRKTSSKGESQKTTSKASKIQSTFIVRLNFRPDNKAGC